MLSVGRYLIYGVVSLAVALPFARRLVDDLGALVKLALVGNLLYYVLLAKAVQLVGVVPTSLIVGILLVTVTLAGRRVNLKRLVGPLALVVAGIVCINLDVFRDLLFGSASSVASVLTRLAGLARARSAR